MFFKKLTLRIVSVFILVSLVQGCNTMRGVGQDIEEAGDAIEDAAE